MCNLSVFPGTSHILKCLPFVASLKVMFYSLVCVKYLRFSVLRSVIVLIAGQVTALIAPRV